MNLKLHNAAVRYGISFLTRLPAWQASHQPTAEVAPLSVVYFPLVGLIIGALLWGVTWLIYPGWVTSSTVVTLLIVALWIWITGALHLDGLADCADAWMSGKQGQEMYTILKDVHSGVGATVAVTLVIVGKVTLLTEIIQLNLIFLILISPLFARALMAVYLVNTEYFPATGLGTTMTNKPYRISVSVIFGMVVLISTLFIDSNLIWIFIASGVTTLALIHCSLTRRLGGTNGDVFGAVVETAELCTLGFGLIFLV